MNASLDCIFRPRSVAVVGASRRRGSIGAEVFHNLIKSGFSGPVYPVNAQAPVVQSVSAYKRLQDIPGEVDLAIIVVPKHLVSSVIDDCADKGVKGIVVLSAGFGELGAEGQGLQRQLRDKVLAGGMRMIGPNCLGVINTNSNVGLNATFAPTWPPLGGVAIASQSGAVGLALLDYARDLGIGISQFASMGNKADVSGNDLLEYWEADPDTRVIALYLESLGNPARFMDVTRRVSRKKPIVVVKSGRTEAGARAAASHTGALAGMDIAVDALFKQAGVIRTDTIEALFDVVTLLANQPVPAGNRVAILTNAGGPAIMASDACESRGLKLPTFTPETMAALKAALPNEAALNNPVDMLASAPAATYERCIELLLADPNVDVVLVLFVPPLVTDATDVAHAIRRASVDAKKPILVCLLGTEAVHRGQELLRETHIPTYGFPEAAVGALASAVEYRRFLNQPEAHPVEFADTERARAEAVMKRALARTPDGWLTGDETRDLLQAYGVKMPTTATAASLTDALARAREIGYPVALKLLSRTLVHKTEVNGVHLNVRGPEELKRAYEAIEAGARTVSPEAMDGVLIQQMITGGVEMYVGMTEAPGFGALLAVGAGGVAIEVFRDVAFRVHPLTDVDARDMVEQVRAKALLRGFRGAPVADERALLDAVLRVDRLIAECVEIRELDVNPLVVLPAGQGVVALDARVRIGSRKGG